jgi:tRNA threonylcarbamoyladenosine biosynthesis protein TsaB
MRVLAIESATDACSVALFDTTPDGATMLAHSHEVIGRGHAERLVPAIADLPGKGRADRILVSLGPGSFTGVRIGLAAARALGLAWGCEVLGYPTLALLAAMARQAHGPAEVTVCMNGGHGEWFTGQFTADGLPRGGVVSLTPAGAAAAGAAPIVAGNRAGELAAMLGPGHAVVDILPDAACALLLPPALLTTDLAPIYGRGPDAALPGEARKRR